jgi:hypothetical protein
MSLTVDALDANGAAVAGFGTAGRADVQATAGDDVPDAVVVDSAGNVVVAGATDVATDKDTLTVRLDDAGAMDPSFGASGVELRSLDAARNDRVETLFEVDDGRLLALVRRDLDGSSDRLVPLRLGTTTIPQYQDGIADWETAGTAHFGICLASTSGASTGWATDANCLPSADPWWRALPASATSVASTPGLGDGTVRLRFGLRLDASRSTGTYIAPVSFTVVSP